MLALSLAVLTIFYFVEMLRRYLREKSNGIPGPISNWIPFFGPLYRTIIFVKNHDRLLDLLCDEQAKYGPIWTFQGLVGPRLVCVTDPVNLEYVLNKPDLFIKGPRFQKNFNELLGHGIFNVNGSQWTIQRRLAGHMFTRRSLREMVAIFDEHCEHLLDYFQRAKQSGEPMIVQDALMRFTLDSFSEISGMGKANTLLEPLPFPGAFDTAQASVTDRFTNPLFIFLDPLGLSGLLQSEKRLAPAIDTINVYAKQVIEKKRSEHAVAAPAAAESSTDEGEELLDDFGEPTSSPKSYRVDRRDLITRYLDLDPNMETTVIRDAVQNFILAGRDTTAVCLTWTLYQLAKNPDVYEQLADEVRRELGPTGTPTYDQLSKMPYIRAVIKETLRLHPSVPWDPKETSEATTMPGGQKIASNVVVSWVAYATGRNPKLWPDPMRYNPGRFIDSDLHNGGVKVTKYAFPAFQPGQRQCLGMELAFTEVAFVLARLCQRGFRFEVPPGENGDYNISIILTAKQMKLKIV